MTVCGIAARLRGCKPFILRIYLKCGMFGCCSGDGWIASVVCSIAVKFEIVWQKNDVSALIFVERRRHFFLFLGSRARALCSVANIENVSIWQEGRVEVLIQTGHLLFHFDSKFLSKLFRCHLFHP